MKRPFLFIFTLAFLVGTPVAAQQERMTGAEYNTALGNALGTASSRDRRVLTDETFYTGVQITGKRRIVYDFIGADSKQVEVTEEFNGKKATSQSVTAGRDYFCRAGSELWKVSKKDCLKHSMLAIPDGNYEYSVETDAKNAARKIYSRRATFADSGSAEREAVRMNFIEIKFITDETGAIVEYTETRRGGVEPNGWSSTQVTKYEYDVKDLNITDPTKQN